MNIKKSIEKYESYLEDYSDTSISERQRWQIVIEFLRKQIPTKPTEQNNCSVCGSNLFGFPYCNICGQKIDWDGTLAEPL